MWSNFVSSIVIVDIEYCIFIFFLTFPKYDGLYDVFLDLNLQQLQVGAITRGRILLEDLCWWIDRELATSGQLVERGPQVKWTRSWLAVWSTDSTVKLSGDGLEFIGVEQVAAVVLWAVFLFPDRTGAMWWMIWWVEPHLKPGLCANILCCCFCVSTTFVVNMTKTCFVDIVLSCWCVYLGSHCFWRF